MSSANAASIAPHIVIVGGAYAGLSALNSLVSLSEGKGHPEGKKRGFPQGDSGRSTGFESPPNEATKRTAAPDGAPSRALKTKPRYTILDERDGFYHTVGAPLGQISAPFAREFWVRFDEILTTKPDEDIEFIHGSAIALDMESKILTVSPANSPAEMQNLSYDFLIIASGMRRKWPVVPRAFDYDSYIRDVEDWERELRQCNRIVLVGGGACGIEMVAELKVHFAEKEIILIHSRNQLLSNEPLSDEYKSIALKLLREQGVEVLLNTRLEHDKANPSDNSRSLVLSTGDSLTCDKVIYTAVQQGANTNFVPKALTEEKRGCVKVRDTFQFVSNFPNADVHYAVGDAAHWPSTIKRCGPAQSQGKHAATNIIASLIALEDGNDISEAELESCPPSKATMTLAIGEQAIGMRKGLSYGKGVKMGAFGTGLGIDGTLASLGLRPRRRQEVGHDAMALEDARL